MDERIDALLTDLEGSHAALERHVRRGELAEELAAQSAERSLRERLRGALGRPVRLTAAGREVVGTAAFLGAGILVVTGTETTIVATDRIAWLRTSDRHHVIAEGGLERLGMASALRRLGALREEVTVVLIEEGTTLRGHLQLVAADYLEIAGRIVPLGAIALVIAAVDPFA
ncbi:hypothetical protein DFO66_10395 [Brevibacterium sanguinis]|uniref:Uncharacterized protein n=2 Tax=Brevibacterium TaxID=1696 RepID=A0A366IK44_9MICO|nr:MULTISPECIES: hypothetical protein [Brevibacterium]RBP66152.1 hypothetical protein DFO66_10395 [Brevibacterium sanguinis]RBP72803.1 hypothetical protein DFO65_10394 [Brevibacterium celere]